jgi:hypothetical protein
MDRYRDFDTFEAEEEGEAVRFKVAGEEFALPPTMPAAVVVKTLRLKKQYASDSDVPAQELMELSLALFGQTELDRLVATGISMARLGSILGWLMQQYQGGGPEGNAPEAASTLSSTGRKSKRTSKGSIKSTSRKARSKR